MAVADAISTVEQLALQQQIELLQQQQQQIAATHQQYVNMGMIPQQQQLPTVNYSSAQPGALTGISSHINNFQFPPQLQQQQGLGVPLGAPTQPSSHRRNQSALPNMGMGPPPAPSSGASGTAFGDFSQANQSRDSSGQRGGRGGGPSGGGHQRRHSLALPEAKKAAEIAQSKRVTSGFQFPIPGASGASPSSTTNPTAAPEADDKSARGQLLSPDSSLNPRPGNRVSQLGHGRSQSMAIGSGRGGAAGGRGAGGFQFPPPMATNDAGASGANQSDFQRRGSSNIGHGRTSSRNFDGNWRQQSSGQSQDQQQQPQQQQMGSFNQNQNPNATVFQPGQRPRGATMNNAQLSSMGGFQYPQPQLVPLPQGQVMIQPQMFTGQQLNQLQVSQLQALQVAQMGGQSFGLQASQHAPQLSGQQQQQRKTLFTPYLPQASLPALLSDGQLVAGILRVNKKNRSDAYVTTTDLDADIFICGSKDRNRALEGDLVAIELLDVDEVWGQKREKEEKKKRKDVTDSRIGAGTSSDRLSRSDSTQNDNSQVINGEGGLKRRGSLRQRPTQKKNDDVEVEGQSLLLMEEEEVNDEQKPLYAGHVVAVVERIPGQMFSGYVQLLDMGI
jgi:protein SSD1